jgi:hypothetical protein
MNKFPRKIKNKLAIKSLWLKLDRVNKNNANRTSAVLINSIIISVFAVLLIKIFIKIGVT